MYDIVAVPDETPLTMPDEDPITAIVLLLLLQVPPVVVQVSVVVETVVTEVAPVIAEGRGLTVTEDVKPDPVQPLSSVTITP